MMKRILVVLFLAAVSGAAPLVSADCCNPGSACCGASCCGK